MRSEPLPGWHACEGSDRVTFTIAEGKGGNLNVSPARVRHNNNNELELQAAKVVGNASHDDRNRKINLCPEKCYH